MRKSQFKFQNTDYQSNLSTKWLKLGSFLTDLILTKNQIEIEIEIEQDENSKEIIFVYEPFFKPVFLMNYKFYLFR